jgi:hypothetical protein
MKEIKNGRTKGTRGSVKVVCDATKVRSYIRVPNQFSFALLESTKHISQTPECIRTNLEVAKKSCPQHPKFVIIPQKWVGATPESIKFIMTKKHTQKKVGL